MLRKMLLFALLGALFVTAGGCLPLMVGSLGYQAYRYEKTGEIPGVPSNFGQASNQNSPASPRPQDDDVE